MRALPVCMQPVVRQVLVLPAGAHRDAAWDVDVTDEWMFAVAGSGCRRATSALLAGQAMRLARSCPSTAPATPRPRRARST